MRLDAPGQAAPVTLHTAALGFASQRDTRQTQTYRTALFAALIRHRAIQQNLQQQTTCIVLRQHIEHLWRSDRSWYLGNSGGRRDAGQGGNPLDHSTNHQANQHTDQDHRCHPDRTTTNTLGPFTTGGRRFIHGVQTIELQTLGWRGAALLKIAQHVVDQAHGNHSSHCANQGQAPITSSKDRLAAANPQPSQGVLLCRNGRAPSVSSWARRT